MENHNFENYNYYHMLIAMHAYVYVHVYLWDMWKKLIVKYTMYVAMLQYL